MTKVITVNSNDLGTFKAELTEALAKGHATVTFTKKDGSTRTMKCTAQEGVIPATASTRDVAGVQTVYDLDLGEWRSFRWDSVKSAEVDA